MALYIHVCPIIYTSSQCLFPCLQLLRDKQLLFIIAGLLAVDTLIIILWVTIDPMKRHITSFPDEVSGTTSGRVFNLVISDNVNSGNFLSRILSLAFFICYPIKFLD